MLALGDLPTLVQRKSRVVHLILNNESLDFVKIEQQEAGFVPFGVDFKNPNFARVAEAMGAKGIRLEEPGDVREALRGALAYKDGPVVVDAVVDPYALSLPSHVPFHTAKDYTLSLAKQVWTVRRRDQDDGAQRQADLSEAGQFCGDKFMERALAPQLDNKALVQASFERWKNGTGGPFELLAPDAEWTIVGSSRLSKTYRSKQEFLDKVIGPFDAGWRNRWSQPSEASMPTGVYSVHNMVTWLSLLPNMAHTIEVYLD